MKYLLTICVILIIVGIGTSQNKRDYVWILGGDHNSPVPGPDMYTFDFNNVPFTPIATDNFYDMRANTSISDEDGNLLFYSNGCAILNASRQVMAGGDSINYGSFFDWYNWPNDPDCSGGYPFNQDIIALTDPKYKNGYYMIHKRKTRILPKPSFINEILYSYVDMELDDGKGAVIEKNILFYQEDTLLSSYLTAIHHKNRRDWWIIQPQKDTNIYVTFLLDSTGIHRQPNQSIGKNFHWNSSAAGTAKFSPDGTKYALYNVADGVLLFDFDRSTGLLSNYRRTIPDATSNFSSIEWSPNSKYVYTASGIELFQIDIEADDLEEATVLIAEYDGTQNPFPNRFFLMALGPDCRIYMCSTSGNETYHVINNPDEKGMDCNFDQNGLTLPHAAGLGSMPNHPRWRVDEEDKCDPTISSVFGIPVYTRKKLEIYPNPTSDIVDIKIPKRGKGTIEVRNSIGQIVQNVNIESQELEVQINLGLYSDGMYYIDYSPDNNKNRVLYSTKVEVIN